MQGLGVKRAQGFWLEAWGSVIKRPGAILGLTWIGIVGFFAVFAPLIANGHPLILRNLDDQGDVTSTEFPLFEYLTAPDWLLILGAIAGTVFFLIPLKLPRPDRLGIIVTAAVQLSFAYLLLALLKSDLGNTAFWGVLESLRNLETNATLEKYEFVLFGVEITPFAIGAVTLIGALSVLLAVQVPTIEKFLPRAFVAFVVAVIAAPVFLLTWTQPLTVYDYSERELRGEISTVYTIVPWSPAERVSDRNTRTLEPGRTEGYALEKNFFNRLPPTGSVGEQGLDLVRDLTEPLPLPPEVIEQFLIDFDAEFGSKPNSDVEDVLNFIKAEFQPYGRAFYAGSDKLGQDVLAQMMHACRLAISIGLVSTGLAVLIGVTMGALMGYFGGWVDMLLYRVVEIFMAIPVLFLLIVAAGVLPKNIYIMMIIIGCFSWTGAARFVRAEFFKLRNQDFVQAAQSMGLPLRSVLFKHMLPNGVTPVLVESSFAIAAAILAEATLSFLGLGPDDQPSWGRLLADATGETGEFNWWLATFPGFAIFLTVLGYNLIGEAFRDAIDPKLKKARH